VNSKRQENKMRTITWNQAQEIIDIACDEWKEKLTEQWAKNIVLKKDIDVSDSSYRIMRKACTDEQHKLFDKIFGKEKEEIKIVIDSRCYGLSVDGFPLTSVCNSNNKIKLNDNFNWTLEDNILTVSHHD
jgi:hypothetical protein